VWLRSGSLATAIKASFSIPGLFKPVEIGGRWLVDGALVNPVPVSVCRALGAQFVIAVRFDASGAIGHDVYSHAAANGADVSQVLGSRRPPTTAMGSMLAAVNLVQDRTTRSRLVADPPDISINIKASHIGLMDFNRAPEMIQLGRRAVRRVKTDLLDALYHAGHLPIPEPDMATPEGGHGAAAGK
jgi:NTE family protein